MRASPIGTYSPSIQAHPSANRSSIACPPYSPGALFPALARPATGHLEGADRPAEAILQDFIDLLRRGEPLGDDLLRLVDYGHQDAVGDEAPVARRVLDHDGILAGSHRDLDHGVADLVAGRRVDSDL